MHHRWARKCLCKEDDLGVLGVDLGNQLLPKLNGFGVGVIDPVDLYPEGNPLLQNPHDLAVDTLWVLVKVDRVDVLIFLWRVLCVCDSPVGPGGEPLRVCLHPWVVGRGLKSQVHRNFDTKLACGLHKRRKVLFGSKVGMNGVMATLFTPDCPGGTRVSLLRN